MKRMIIVALSALFIVALAIPAVALTDAQQVRKAACEAIDPGPNVTATYTAGSTPAGSQDKCVVVSTATTIEESIEQVNNPRAAKAVNRVVVTEKTVTTTQGYRWQVGQSKWVAGGDNVTAEEEAILEECKRTPGKDFCA